MLKIVIGTNEGKVLCISNNEDKIKASMVHYLIDTDQEPTEDFFESRNWGEYDIEVYEYHQPQLNKNQQQVLGWLKVGHCDGDSVFEALERIADVYEDPKTEEALESLSPDQEVQVISSFMKWALEQEEE